MRKCSNKTRNLWIMYMSVATNVGSVIYCLLNEFIGQFQALVDDDVLPPSLTRRAFAQRREGQMWHCEQAQPIHSIAKAYVFILFTHNVKNMIEHEMCDMN